MFLKFNPELNETPCLFSEVETQFGLLSNSSGMLGLEHDLDGDPLLPLLPMLPFFSPIFPCSNFFLSPQDSHWFSSVSPASRAATVAARHIRLQLRAVRMCGPFSTRIHHAFRHHVMCLSDTWLFSCSEFSFLLSSSLLSRPCASTLSSSSGSPGHQFFPLHFLAPLFLLLFLAPLWRLSGRCNLPEASATCPGIVFSAAGIIISLTFVVLPRIN